jgi:hypothetical protein
MRYLIPGFLIPGFLAVSAAVLAQTPPLTGTSSANGTGYPVGGSAGPSSSSSGSSSSGGASPSAVAGVPAPAAAAGYTTLTFGPAVTIGGNWVPFRFYGQGAPQTGYASQNADGSVYISGSGTTTTQALATATPASNVTKWSGAAFGPGYYEAVISYQYPNNYNFDGGASFWGLDIEHTSQGPYDFCWPSSPPLGNSDGTSDKAPNPCYDDFFEIDFFEADAATAAHPTCYQNGIGAWYNHVNGSSQSTSNPYQAVRGSAGSVCVPAGTDFSQPHRYGWLWVAAQGSGQTTTHQGYMQFFFDGVQTGSTYYWNYHDPSQVSSYPAPPPVIGDTAISGMDWRHMFLILGTDPAHPMTVYSVSVWQKSAAQNLVIPPPSMAVSGVKVES